MKPLLLISLIFANSLIAFGQTEVYKESFAFSYLVKKYGAQFRYNGKSHSFIIDIESDSIRTTDAENYIALGNHIVQTSIVPIPVGNLDLDRLSTAQQKTTLNSYINYELDYFKNGLKIEYQNLRKEWITIDSKLWVLWTFDVPRMKKTGSESSQIKSQIYVSTICFNQVLDLNTPVIEGDDPSLLKEILVKLMKTLKLFDTHF